MTGPPGGEGLSIGEAAAEVGLSTHTLRYYDRAGLSVTEVGRSAGGRRRYLPRDLEWLRICTKLRATGMPIDAIQRYCELVRSGPGNEDQRLALLCEHRDAVRRQIEELTTNLRLIDYKIDVYSHRLEAGTADQLWAQPPPDSPSAPS